MTKILTTPQQVVSKVNRHNSLKFYAGIAIHAA